MPTIRNATPDDVPQLTNLLRAANQDVAQTFNLTPANCPTHPSNCQPAWIETAMAKGIQFYILENKIPCGCVALEQAKPGACYLERLAVLPPYRKRGYGRALVAHSLAQASQWGNKRVEIAIIAQHAKLQTWYEQLGFTTTHTKSFDHLPFDVTFLFINL